MRFDLLLRGGEVIDPGGRSAALDVGVRAGRIAAVEPGLDPAGAREVADVSGLVVTPGLVDLHTHVGIGYWGIDPDPVAWCTGVTTWVDAGSAGAYTFRAFRAYAQTRRVRTPALLNVAGPGLAGQTGEGRDPAALDVDAAIATVLGNRDVIVGVKARLDSGAAGSLEPLRRALTVAEAGGLPVMAHIGVAPPRADEVLDLLRPGDIVTHCASGLAEGLLDGGRPSRAVVDAYARGVLFDLGHGAGGFSFATLDALLAAGLPPHTVSTDLHARSVFGPVFDLPTTMAKLLAAGLPLADVIAAATVRPARALGLPGGTLTVGGPADIAVFAVTEEPFDVADVHLTVRTAPRRLANVATYVDGALLPPLLPPGPPPWIPLTGAQRAALDARTRIFRDLLTQPLVAADGLDEQFRRQE
ncbi:amidohydrolase family protein [Hamadaea tsunoensis]|uniref:amidohydrolase family protein n=1 Tax=Hamadaea tsunoensis TaxID=53368 RepID=UPI000420730B|nr:amidohydrolase/deacetylase family metallohydrolase [Hamadaea tsunoensis]